MLKVASCDSQGAVYVDSDAVYRLVDRSHEESVLIILKSINTADIEGVVQTEICSDGEVIDSINDAREALVLKHKKISYISYPHEWCASMLKDAALFHLELSERLFGHGLFLKDAHPWNILFEKGHPVFIDFTSIVSSDSLLAEEYLEANKLHRGEDTETRLACVHKEIFERMYLPYFIRPLSAYAFGQRSRVGKEIERTTLNSSTSIISMRACLPKVRLRISMFTQLLGLLKSRVRVKKIIRQVIEKKDVPGFFREMKQCVTNIKVAVDNSAYSAYYRLKGEDNEQVYSEKWNAKQKAVYNALNIADVNSVLDVACNTGWYAIMAEKLGKRVVAFDIDEGCIENLYSQVKNDQLDILPLVLNFTELTQDRYSIYDGKKVLINASQRLRSDSVIALGIVHHLVLGLGMTFEKVLDRLIPLCEKQLVIEFVDTLDEKIVDEPTFFPAYNANRNLAENYDLDTFMICLNKYYSKVTIKDSYPGTRTILICENKICN